MLINSPGRSYESDNDLRQQYGNRMIKDENKDYSDDEDERLDIEEDMPRKDKLMEGEFFFESIAQNFLLIRTFFIQIVILECFFRMFFRFRKKS